MKKPKQYMSLILKQFCKVNNFTYLEEFKFLQNRKFRFDWYIPELRIGIEYEGIMSGKSRHTSVAGFTKDCEKYNLAQINNYTVLRFTVMNYTEIEKYLAMFIENASWEPDYINMKND